MKGSFPFWSHFEEPVISKKEKIDMPLFAMTKTITEGREQPDHENIGFRAITHSITNTREERDQDPHHTGYSSIPFHSVIATETFTRMREAPDPDPYYTGSGYSSLPKLSVTAIGTITKEREEPDQDVSTCAYRTIPQ